MAAIILGLTFLMKKQSTPIEYYILCGSFFAEVDVAGCKNRYIDDATFTALGALYLKPMPWSLLWRLIVYSRVTTSPIVLVFSLRGISPKLTSLQ